MQRLIELIVRFKEMITFAALIIISLSLISMGNVSQIGGFRTVVIGATGWLQELFSWVPNPGALESENKALRELNLKLSSEVTRMRHALIENKELRKLMELEEAQERPYITSEIVGKTTVEMRQYFTLASGAADSVRRGMTVRSDAGLCGVVVGVSENYSLVELIANRNIKISAKIQRTDINGILAWEGGNNFLLKNIPGSFDVQTGDIVMTSNFSNKFPEGIPIGQIILIEEDKSSLFLKIKVKPFVDFNTIEEVFVILHTPDPERQQLIEEMEQRLKARTGRR